MRRQRLVTRSLTRRIGPIVAILALTISSLSLAGTSVADWRSHPEMTLNTPTPRYVPLVSSATAIALLNRQRAANGIPGDLITNSKLSAGCAKHVWKYKEKIGQIPHEEIPGQPGYSKLGALAASLSALSSRSGESSTESYWWGPLVNPWSGAAFHLSTLFNPEATMAWYAESVHGVAKRSHKGSSWPWGPAACMGAGGSRSFSTPTFFSYPGGGARDVPYSEYTVEAPESPQEAVGLPRGFNGGPAVILWAEGMSARLDRATLSADSGSVVPTKLFAPQTVGDEDSGRGYGYVVPTTDLRPSTHYTLNAVWTRNLPGNPEGESVTQVATFTTGDQTLSQQMHAANVAAGVVPAEEGSDGFSVRNHGRSLTVFAFGTAIGHKVLVNAWRCNSGETWSCDPAQSQRLMHRRFRLHKGKTTIHLPRIKGGGQRACASIRMVPFRLHGKRITSSGVSYRCYHR